MCQSQRPGLRRMSLDDWGTEQEVNSGMRIELVAEPEVGDNNQK